MTDTVAERSPSLAHAVRPAEASHPRRWLVLPVLLTGAFLLPLDFSIVNVALPSIRASLDASSGELQLTMAFYAVAYAVLLITGGRLGDMFGRKAMFLAGMAGFMVASALCGFAPTIHVLIAGRLIQGVAAAMMSPQVLATIRTIFPPAERSRALGYYGAMIGLALVLGQLVRRRADQPASVRPHLAVRSSWSTCRSGRWTWPRHRGCCRQTSGRPSGSIFRAWWCCR